ncbi:MAG: heavy-metal-associated domain-containing protein [Ruminococcaceae bacterium]|nr:heavy-metal-associated domain-containing protein [Oscillospiraceae bacterium]
MTDLIISIVIAVFIVVGIIYVRKHFKRQSGCCGGGGEYISKKKLKNIAAKKVFVVDGMTCEKCKARIERYLNDISGVAATANVKKKEVTVSMAKHYSDDEITSVIEKAGFKVLEIK